MDLTMKCIHMKRVNCKKAFPIVVDEDVNVSDNKPDVHSILWKTGSVRIGEKRTLGNRLVLSGTLLYSVLYSGEAGAEALACIRGEIPFEETVELSEDCSPENLRVRMEVERLEIGMIHSRKLSVKAEIGVLVRSEELTDLRAAVGVEQEDTLQTKRRRLAVTGLAVDHKDTARLKEEVFLPSQKEGIGELVYWELELGDYSVKSKAEAVELRGELSLFALWKGERGGFDSMRAQLPFSTEIEISGCREGMIEDVELVLGGENVSVKRDEDGEARILLAEAVLEAEMKLYEEEEIELLEDFYATDSDTKPVYELQEYETLRLKNESRMRFLERIALPNGIPELMQVCVGRVELHPEYGKREKGKMKLAGKAEISLLYISGADENPYVVFRTELPFEHYPELKEASEGDAVDVTCRVAEASFLSTRNREIEVRAEFVFTILETGKDTERVIVEAEHSALTAEQEESVPALTGYYVQKGDTMWEIAKKYRVPEEEILRILGKSEEPAEGEPLLICKWRK